VFRAPLGDDCIRISARSLVTEHWDAQRCSRIIVCLAVFVQYRLATYGWTYGRARDHSIYGHSTASRGKIKLLSQKTIQPTKCKLTNRRTLNRVNRDIYLSYVWASLSSTCWRKKGLYTSFSERPQWSLAGLYIRLDGFHRRGRVTSLVIWTQPADIVQVVVEAPTSPADYTAVVAYIRGPTQAPRRQNTLNPVTSQWPPISCLERRGPDHLQEVFSVAPSDVLLPPTLVVQVGHWVRCVCPGRTRSTVLKTLKTPPELEGLDTGPIAENMTSSTKPEVHNVLHCHQRTESRPQTTRTETFVKFGHAVFTARRYACEVKLVNKVNSVQQLAST